MKLLVSIQFFFQSLFDFLISLLRIGVFTKPSIVYLPSREKRNKQLLILGNGPSLTNDLKHKTEDFNQYDFLVVNHFAENDLFEQIKPSFYCVGAPELFQDNAIEELKTKSVQLLQAIYSKTKWPMTLYLNSAALRSEQWISLLKKNTNIKLRFFNKTPIEGLFRYFFWRYNVGLPRPHNVLIPSIIIGINENYKSIYLFGADHSWLKDIAVSNNNEALLNQKHFYDEKTSTAKPMRKDLKGLEARKLHEILHKFYLSFKGYHDIDTFSKKYDVIIYNLTTDSFIDAFERKESC